MMIGGKLEELTANREVHLKHYNHCIALVICNPPLPACYLRICQYCPGISKLKDYLNEVMDDNYIDSIQYKQWVSVDRSTLETITKPACTTQKHQVLGNRCPGLLLQTAFFRCCKTTRVHVMVLGRVNRTAWGTKLLLTAVWASLVDCTVTYWRHNTAL